MRSFEEIYALAEARKGGAAALEALLSKPKRVKDLESATDDRWLSQMTKCIFQAGFNWKVVDQKWPGFEAAFSGFDLGRCAMLHDEEVEQLAQDSRIIRNPAKIKSVPANARFLLGLAEKHGSAAKAFAHWPSERYVELLALLKKEGERLGGLTGQRLLRSMGVDSFVLSPDVVARLMAEDVVQKSPSSKRDMQAVQAAFNCWRDQSGRSFTEISRVFAYSLDS